MNKQLSFLEASKILKKISNSNLPKKSISILSSFEHSQLEIYLKAFFGLNGFEINIEKLEFGTLKQTLIKNNFNDFEKDTLILLTPWDFIESLNWRTGISDNIGKQEILEREIDLFYKLCRNCLWIRFRSILRRT